MKKARIDAVLAEQGLFPSRTAAAGAVRAGAVRVGRDGPVALRPSQLVEPEAALIVDEGPRFVSRGGIKLDNALDALGLDVSGKDCVDVGASTGGFTHVLLERGAAHVVALDVGHGQLAAALRGDARVTVMEGCNARDLKGGDLPYAPDLVVVDVSFISLRLALAAALALAAPGARLVALVKPQFEAGRKALGKGGIVRDRAVQEVVCGEIAAWLEHDQGWRVLGRMASPLAGGDGNREFLIHALKS